MRNITITMPPGEYYLGDPCYVIARERWAEYAAMAQTGAKTFLIDGMECLEFSTGCGDGEFQGSNGFRYIVDSGRIGLLPTTLVSPGRKMDNGTLLAYDTPFTCSADHPRKKLRFGSITIDVG